MVCLFRQIYSSGRRHVDACGRQPCRTVVSDFQNKAKTKATLFSKIKAVPVLDCEYYTMPKAGSRNRRWTRIDAVPVHRRCIMLHTVVFVPWPHRSSSRRFVDAPTLSPPSYNTSIQSLCSPYYYDTVYNSERYVVNGRTNPTEELRK